MLLLHDLEGYDGAPCALAMGVFDGMHIGHRRLILSAVRKARSDGLKSVVLTYDRHPMEVFDPGHAPSMLMTNEEKIASIEKTGADVLIMLHFDMELASVLAEEYLAEICAHLHPAYIAVGFNHTFGLGGKGNAKLLIRDQKKYGYTALILDKVEYGNECVSSTRIRRLLSEGKAEEAFKLMHED